MQRDTRQRRELRRVFEAAPRPLSPPDVLREAQRALPRLGIATVYRNLKSMLSAGEIVEVPVPGEASRYERAGMHHHHHFHCTRCGQLFELEGCSDQLKKIRPPKGFQVDRHELTLYGLCGACRA